MAPTPLPDPEILQLQMLVSEQQAKIIELEGEVREGDGYAHRLVKTQDELVHVKGLVKQLFGGPRAPDALLLQAAADFSDPDKERLRVILRELMVIATS